MRPNDNMMFEADYAVLDDLCKHTEDYMLDMAFTEHMRRFLSFM